MGKNGEASQAVERAQSSLDERRVRIENGNLGSLAIAATITQHQKNAEGPDRSKRPWYVCMPDGPLARARDVGVMVALVSLSVFTPFELAFTREISGIDILFIYNRVVDVVFLFDIALQFFLAQEKVDGPKPGKKMSQKDNFERQKQLLSEGQHRTFYDYSLRSIGCSYVSGMLSFDLLALLPSAIDILEMVQYYQMEAEAAEDSDLNLLRGAKTAKLTKMASTSKIFKMMRMTRAMKLIRLINSFEKIKEIEIRVMNHLYAHRRKVTLIKLLLVNNYVVHILACIVGYAINFNDNKLTTFWARNGYCFPNRMDSIGADAFGKVECVGIGTEYLVLFQWALGATLFFGPEGWDQGPGEPLDIFIHDTMNNAFYTRTEYVVFTVASLAAAFWGLYVTGAFINVLTMEEDSPGDQVTSYALSKGLHWKTLHALQEFCGEQEELIKKIPPGDNVLYRLSPRLIEDVMLQVHGQWLIKLPFAAYLLRPPPVFTSSRSEYVYGYSAASVARSAMPFLAKLALAMKPALFIPTEQPPTKRLYVIVKGSAVTIDGGRQLKEGDSWGVLETFRTHVTPTKVRALCYLHTCYITATELADFAKDEEVAPAYANLQKWVFIQICCKVLAKNLKSVKKGGGFTGRVPPATRASGEPDSNAEGSSAPLVPCFEPLGSPPTSDVSEAELLSENCLLREEAARLKRIVGGVQQLFAERDLNLLAAANVFSQDGASAAKPPPRTWTPATSSSRAADLKSAMAADAEREAKLLAQL